MKHFFLTGWTVLTYFYSVAFSATFSDISVHFVNKKWWNAAHAPCWRGVFVLPVDIEEISEQLLCAIIHQVPVCTIFIIK